MMRVSFLHGAWAPRVHFAAWVLAACAAGAVGCSGDDAELRSEESDLKVYLSESYGYVVSFDEEAEQAVGYAVVDGKCWAQPIPQEVWWVSARDDDFMDFDYLGQKQPGIPFYRVVSFEEACPQGTLKTALDEDFALDFELEYELFQRSFAEHYAFFDLRDVDWDDQVEDAEASLSPEMGFEDFFGVLTGSVSPLEDGHIFIEAGEGLSYNENRRADIATKLTEEALTQEDVPDDDVEAYVEGYVEAQFGELQDAIESYFVADSAHGTFEDPISWATIESSDARFGYLWVSTFAYIVESSVDDNIAALHEAVENALADWGDIDGVIIDVRINQGGWDVLGRALASHFVSEGTHVYSKRVYFSGSWTNEVPISVTPFEGERYSGPVVVLSSSTTISAAESFVMAMRSLDHVTVVGEQTYGILSDSLPKFLPSGIYFSLSNEEYSTPHGDTFELTGVPPHVEVEVFSPGDRQAGIDAAIEAAIVALGGG